MKIVVNGDVGSFRLSEEAARLYMNMSGDSLGAGESLEAISRRLAHCPKLRGDPVLVAVIQQLGARANGAGACLEVVDAPADGWHLLELCGIECVVSDAARPTGR
ncbi:hypothetical protein [Paraburkholderia sp. BL9I2N2]|uniref:hypothetical protein n=1 Tax=Paraburkholderia sp. BL9I2N2 TaxID=1938809 RepID=UPI0010536E69|nr:hypothetical protein [Paraburkholderia sp. BL9I2N2]TCK84157.1 hypothetical protein B0G74_8968 [Paraburkholderia sp. BL9I2N2]